MPSEVLRLKEANLANWRKQVSARKKAATAGATTSFLIQTFRSACDGVESLEERRGSDSAAHCHGIDLGLSEN